MPLYSPVLTINRGNGRKHVRVREIADDGKVVRTLVDERCQTDQSGPYDEAPWQRKPFEVQLAEAVVEDRDSVCRFCVPDKG